MIGRERARGIHRVRARRPGHPVTRPRTCSPSPPSRRSAAGDAAGRLPPSLTIDPTTGPSRGRSVGNCAVRPHPTTLQAHTGARSCAARSQRLTEGGSACRGTRILKRPSKEERLDSTSRACERGAPGAAAAAAVGPQPGRDASMDAEPVAGESPSLDSAFALPEPARPAATAEGADADRTRRRASSSPRPRRRNAGSEGEPGPVVASFGIPVIADQAVAAARERPDEPHGGHGRRGRLDPVPRDPATEKIRDRTGTAAEPGPELAASTAGIPTPPRTQTDATAPPR